MKFMIALSGFLLLFAGGYASAQKLTLQGGFYALKADAGDPTTSNRSVNVSSPGIFSLSASFRIVPHVELEPGYTVFFSKGITGDSGFGPDFSLNYFPFSESSKLYQNIPNLNYNETELWRPFAGVSFHQRQFQSIQSSYSGFGFSAGAEYQYNDEHSIRLLLRSMNLNGPTAGKLNDMDVLLGFQLTFH